MAKSGISTELAKLPGNYKMTHHSGLVDYYKGLNLPGDVIKILTNRKDSEMYLALKEKNGEWSYKSTHLIKGFPIGGNEWSFKVGEKFNLAEYEPTDPDNFGRVMEMSVDSVGDSLVLDGQEEMMTFAPLPKHYGEGIVMTRDIKGKDKATLKVYFESVLGLSKEDNKDTNGNKDSDTKSADCG